MNDSVHDIYSDYHGAGKGAGLLPLHENGRVLEIGFGNGRLLQALRDKGNDVYGIDVSQGLVEGARAAGFQNVDLLDVSEEPLPYDGDFFDAIYCYEVFEHLANPYRLFYEIRRTLKVNHRLFFSVPTQEIDMGYGVNRHTFVYPGLLEKKNLERFMMQMYFAVELCLEPEPGENLTGRNYILRNMKSDERPDVMEVIINDCNPGDLYGYLLSEEDRDGVIEHEVMGYVAILRRVIDFGHWGNAILTIKDLLRQYPDYYPMYPLIVELLMTGESPPEARKIAELMTGMEELPPHIKEAMHKARTWQ